MQSKSRYLCLAFVLAVGCSSDNNGTGGVDPSEELSSLTPAQATALCNALKSDYPAKTVDCGSAGSVTIGYGSSGCGGSGDAVKLPPSTCTETVGDATDCLAALYAGSAVCSSTPIAACAALTDPNCD